MSTIKKDQISLYCHFDKIIKGPGTSLQSPALSQKHVRHLPYSTLLFDQVSFWWDLGFKRNKHKCDFHYVTMLVMTSQVLKCMDFTKTQKAKNLKNETFFLRIKEFINYTSSATLLQKNSFVAEVNFKSFLSSLTLFSNLLNIGSLFSDAFLIFTSNLFVTLTAPT